MKLVLAIVAVVGAGLGIFGLQKSMNKKTYF